MNASAKTKVQQNLLAKPHIRQFYEAEGLLVQVVNDFYNAAFRLIAAAEMTTYSASSSNATLHF